MKLELRPSNVDVWMTPLHATRKETAAHREVLSSDECARADRFHYENDARKFICSRAAMRMILSRYLDISPKDVSFAYGQHGKPELVAELRADGIQFNLAHSWENAILAVTCEQRVGVDIEFVDYEASCEQLASRFFSESEARTLLSLPQKERPAAFFSCWTRKEAYMKALGKGFAVPMSSFDMAFGPGVRASLLGSELSANEPERWRVYDITAPRGFKAAVVVEGKEHRLQIRTWKKVTAGHEEVEKLLATQPDVA